MYLPLAMKKLASVTMRGNGLSIAFGNPEKNNGQFDLPCEGGKSEIGSLHGVPALEKKHWRHECVAVTRLRISGQFLEQTNHFRSK